MKNRVYILATLLSILLIAYLMKILYTSKSDDTNTTKTYIPIEYEKNPINNNVEIKFIKEKSTTKEINTTQKNYKELFKEPEDMSLVEKLDSEKELKKLDDESKYIIKEAEKLIKENNLEIKEPILSQKDIEKQQDIKNKLEELQKQIEEMSDE